MQHGGVVVSRLLLGCPVSPEQGAAEEQLLPGLPAVAPAPGNGQQRASWFRVLEALGDRVRQPVRGDRCMARCPSHTDRTPSLSVEWKPDDGDGRTVLNCFGCDADGKQIGADLGLAAGELFDEVRRPRDEPAGRRGRSPQQRKAGKRRGKLGPLPRPLVLADAFAEDEPQHVWQQVETYPYVTGEGRLVQEVVREECGACPERHKRFRQVFVTAQGRRVRTKPEAFEPVLYRTPEVLRAVAQGTPVWLLEGEKDVRTAERLGLVATTNTQGGRAFPTSQAQVLRGADVRVVLDRDATGWDRGVLLHQTLRAVAGRVSLLLPAPLQAKADFTDHIDAGHGLDALLSVDVSEVRAWSDTAAVVARRELVLQALAETRAQLQAAQDATDEQAATRHRQLARRWAQESEIRFEGLARRVEDVDRLVRRTGTVWAGEALQQAQEALHQAQTAAHTAHQLVGLGVAAALQPAPTTSAASTPPAADAPEEEADDDAPPAHRAPPPGLAPQRPAFLIDQGQIVQIHTRTNGEDAPPKTVLGLDVRVVALEFAEKNEFDLTDVRVTQEQPTFCASNPDRLPVLTGVLITWTDPNTGEDAPQTLISAEEWRDNSWLASLPGTPDHDTRPSGTANVRRAVLAVSQPIPQTIRHSSTGWRRAADGTFRFVHARGTIGPDGAQAAPVDLTGPLARFELPTPSTDAAVLRRAFLQSSAGWLDHLPPRVVAPLLGHVYRSVLGQNKWTLALQGAKGSYKSALAALAMQHWGVGWDHGRPATSLSGNGATFNAQRIMMNASKDALFWADDAAPTHGWAKTQQRIEEFARTIHDSENRNRSNREGTKASDGTPPRCSALITSEVPPRPGTSGADRILLVPMHHQEISLSYVKQMDALECRHDRALLMASLLRWLAGDLLGIKQRCESAGRAFTATLQAAREGDRDCDAVGQTYVGWVLMTDFLVHVGALSDAERRHVLDRVEAGLHAANAAARDADTPATTGGLVRELLGHALRSGVAYVEDVRTGGAPEFPLATQLGWYRSEAGYDYDERTKQRTPRYRVDHHRGIRAGYVMQDRDGRDQLLMTTTQFDDVLSAAAGRLSSGVDIGRTEAMRALLEDGVLIAERRRGTTPQMQVKRTLHCLDGAVRRMVALRLGHILDEGLEGEPPVDDDPDDSGPSDAGEAAVPLPAWDSPPPTEAGSRAPALSPADADRGEPGAADVPSPADSTEPEEEEEEGSEAAVPVPDEPTDVDDVQHPGVGCVPPPEGLTSSQPEEAPDVRDHRPPLAVPDADGVASDLSLTSERQPCLMCGRGCTLITGGGDAIHVGCWTNSTTASRRAARGTTGADVASPPASPQPSAAAPAATTPASATRAPAPPAPASPPSPAARSATAPAASASPPRGARAGATRPAATGGRFAGPAAVLHVDGVWLPDGSRHDLPTPLTHVGQVADLAEQVRLGTQVTDRWEEPAQMWLTGPLLAELGVPLADLPADPTRRWDAVQQLTEGVDVVTAATAQGWSVSRPGTCLSAWTRVWREDWAGQRRGVQVALIPAMDEDLPILRDDPDPGTLARRLALFARHVGTPWQMSAGRTGFAHLTALRGRDRDRMFTPVEPVPPARINTLEQDLSWSRPPTSDEAQQRFVHAYDRGGSYAAGLAGLELGIGQAAHHPEGLEFDKKLPGYWRVVVPEAGDWRHPHPLDPRGRRPQQPIWVTTPTLQLARETGYDEVEVREAYVWPEHGRVLDPWYGAVRDGRAALDTDDPDAQVARDLLKVVYTRTIGMMGSEEWRAGREGYAPDRRHHVVAKARANILRRVLQIGRDSDRWPLAVVTDTVLYASDDPDPVTAWPGKPEHLGRGFGQFKPEASGVLAEHVQHLGGRDYAGREHLTDAADWDPSAVSDG